MYFDAHTLTWSQAAAFMCLHPLQQHPKSTICGLASRARTVPAQRVTNYMETNAHTRARDK